LAVCNAKLLELGKDNLFVHH